MFGLFKKQDHGPETLFLVKADQQLHQADTFTQMALIMQFLHEATQKEFYAAQIFLIEKYTQWEVDPVMSAQRDIALMLLEEKRKKG